MTRGLVCVVFLSLWGCGDSAGGTGGTVGTDGGTAGTEASATQTGDGSGSETGEPPPVPEDPPDGAMPGPVADFGSPFDPNVEFYPGPTTIIPSGIPELVAFPNPNGSLDVAWLDTLSPKIVVTHMVPTEEGWENAWHYPLPTLERLGGYARDDDGNRYYLTMVEENELQYETMPTGEHRPDIAKLVKLSPTGQELFSVDLRTDVQEDWPEPLVAPMSFGGSRIAVGGGMVAMTFSCLTEYDPAVSSRHQRQCFFLADAETGDLLQHVPGPGHSWEQRVFWDGSRFVSLLHGDAGLRGIGVITFGPPLEYHQRVAFAVKGGDPSTGGAYQNTFTRLANVVPGDDGYTLLFATENEPNYMGDAVIASRNLALVHIRPDFENAPMGETAYDVQIVDTAQGNPSATDFEVQIVDYWGGSFAGLNKGIAWLTEYQDRNTEHAENPKIVRLEGGELLVLWEKWTLDQPTGLWGMVVDAYGHVTVPAKALGDARLYRGDDIVTLGDEAAWVVGDSTVPQLVLHTIDADLNLERHDLP